MMNRFSPVEIRDDEETPKYVDFSLSEETPKSADFSLTSPGQHQEADDLRNPEGTMDGGDPEPASDSPKSRESREPPVPSADMQHYGPHAVILVFIPVTLSISLVVATIHTSDMLENDFRFERSYWPQDETDTNISLATSLVFATITVWMIIIMTFTFLILYKKRCYKILNFWVFSSSVMTLFLLSHIYLEIILRAYNIPMDRITFLVIIWNFGVGGMFCIFWKGPRLLQQAYLIIISSFIALFIIRSLPSWAPWLVLGIMVFWDLIAVLCPVGPLRQLVEIAEERNELDVPSMIYTVSMVWQDTMTKMKEDWEKDRPLDSSETDGIDLRRRGSLERLKEKQWNAWCKKKLFGSSVDKRHRKRKKRNGVTIQDGEGSQEQRQEQAESECSGVETEPEITHRGLKLGLGDFVFYGVLVGKASEDADWIATLACFFAILIGLCCTLGLLAKYRKALPALPISLTFGLVFYFTTTKFLSPFLNSMSDRQVYL